MGRELGITALTVMDGYKVIVHDDVYDEYDQECIVHLHKVFVPNPKNKDKMIERVSEIVLVNDEFTFTYDMRSGYVNGKFTVYTKD